MKTIKILIFVLAVLVLAGIVVSVIRNSKNKSNNTNQCPENAYDVCYNQGFDNAVAYYNGAGLPYKDGGEYSCYECAAGYSAGFTDGELSAL